MKTAVGRREGIITQDRTGGWMKQGYEFEDFVASDAVLFGDSTEARIASRSGVAYHIPPVADVSQRLHTIADTIVEAVIVALDQTILRELVSERQLYNALNESLREKIWRSDTQVAVASTSLTTTGQTCFILPSDSDLEDQLPTSYRHESAVVTNAFREMAKSFRPDGKLERPQFVEEIAE